MWILFWRRRAKKRTLVLRQSDPCGGTCGVAEQCCGDSGCIPSDWTCCAGGPWYCEIGPCVPCPNNNCVGNNDTEVVDNAPWTCGSSNTPTPTTTSIAKPTTTPTTTSTSTPTSTSTTPTSTPTTTSTPQPTTSPTHTTTPPTTKPTPPVTIITPSPPSSTSQPSLPTSVPTLVTVSNTAPTLTSPLPPSTFPTLPPRTDPHDDLLRGYCATPLFSELLGPQSTVIYFVGVVGCMDNKPDCCPYTDTASGTTTTTATITTTATTQSNQLDFPAPPPVTDQETLPVCPGDYWTVDNVCCPSGYGLWTEAVGGVTPCFSTLPSSSYLTPPPAAPPTTSAAPGAPSTITNTIVNVVYARNYPVQGSGGFKTAAKAGVGTGVGVAGLAALVVLGFLLYRRRRNRRISDGYGPPVQQISWDPAAAP